MLEISCFLQKVHNFLFIHSTNNTRHGYDTSLWWSFRLHFETFDVRYLLHVEWNVVTSLKLTYNAVMKVRGGSTSEKSKRSDQCRNPGFLQSKVTTSERRLNEQRQHQRAHSNCKQNLRCIPPTYNSKLPSLSNTLITGKNTRFNPRKP